MSFIYFVANAGGKAAITLPDCLRYITDGGKTHARDIAKGPSDGPGRLWSSHAIDAGQLRYEPATQQWIDAGGYWIGMSSPATHHPSPATLCRDEAVPGVDVVLGDGQPWRVPIARAWLLDEQQIRWAAHFAM